MTPSKYAKNPDIDSTFICFFRCLYGNAGNPESIRSNNATDLLPNFIELRFLYREDFGA